MDEVLNKLLSNELLTDESRAELAEAFKAHLAQVEADARVAVEAEVRVELTTKYKEDFDKLVEAVDTKSETIIRAELAELHEDIARFRDLEVEYTEKLVEARHELAASFKEDMAILIDKLDVFIEGRMETEFAELKESIEEVKKNKLGQSLFETFMAQANADWFDKSGFSKELSESKAALATAKAELETQVSELNEMKRSAKMKSLLESLSGRPYEVMEAILKNFETDKLEETYNTFIPRVLHESSKGNVSEKESAPVSTEAPVLAEEVTPAPVVESVLVTGDAPALVTESVAKATLSPLQQRLQRLALGE